MGPLLVVMTMTTPSICPHCGERGRVHGQVVKYRKGISRAKAASALLTGAASLAVVGIGKNCQVTEFSCHACGMTWHAA